MIRKTLLCAAAMAPALSPAQGMPIEFSFDSALYTKYVWRGINIVNGPVWQPSLNASTGAWSLNLWGSLELADTNDYGPGFGNGRGQFTEVDTTLTYEASSGPWDWSLGVVRYDFPNTGFKKTSEVFATATYNAEWSPSLEVYQDVDAVKGASGQFSLSRSWDAQGGELTLTFATSFGTNAYTENYFGAVEAGFSDFEAGLAYSREIGKSTTLNLYGTYSTIFDKDLLPGSGKRDNVVFGAGVSFVF